MEPHSTQHMKNIMDRICKEQTIPNNWKEDIIVPKEKKKGTKQPEEHRGIFLINTMAKWMMQV
eukprot:12283093-Prorocentrum_lima.AAC.1